MTTIAARPMQADEARRIRQRKQRVSRALVYIFVYVMAFVSLIPFLWMVDTGLLWVTQKLLGTGG